MSRCHEFPSIGTMLKKKEIFVLFEVPSASLNNWSFSDTTNLAVQAFIVGFVVLTYLGFKDLELEHRAIRRAKRKYEAELVRKLYKLGECSNTTVEKFTQTYDGEDDAENDGQRQSDDEEDYETVRVGKCV